MVSANIVLVWMPNNIVDEGSVEMKSVPVHGGSRVVSESKCEWKEGFM